MIHRNLPGAPDDLFDILFSPFIFNNGELCPYGFGFFYDENSRDIIWQHGDNTGWQSVIRADLKKNWSIIVLTYSDCQPVETALDLENAIIGKFYNLPEQINYKSAYNNRPKHISNIRKIKYDDFPNARKQYSLSDSNINKYLGRYYSCEMDTYFDIVPNDSHFQMKYADRYDDGYINLLHFSDKNNIIAYTRGDWGGDWLPIEFYGDENKIYFFILQESVGHFYFIKCSK